MKKLRISKKMISKQLRASDLRRIIRTQLTSKIPSKTILQIARSGYTTEQKTKLKNVMRTKGYAAYRQQAKRYKSSNKANLIKSILRSKYGVKYAKREYNRILKETTGEHKQKLTKAENRARARLYLNRLTAREFVARSKQAKESIRLQRQFLKEKFNAIINAGVSLNFTKVGNQGIAIEEYIDKYWSMELQEKLEEASQNNEQITEADAYHEVWMDLTSGALGNLEPLKQGAEYGYWDDENQEVISPV